MTALFPGLEEFEEARKHQSQARYDARMLMRMLLRLTDDEHAKEIQYEAGDEFSFMWFNGAYNPPICITVAKLNGQHIGDLLLNSFMKHPIVQAFLDVRATYDEETKVGVVFPLLAKSNWIIHDGSIPLIPGVNAIIRKGQDDSQLTVQPFDSFVDGLRQRWQP